MRMGERRALERALQNHYQADTALEVAPRALIDAMARELARPARPRAWEVVAAQVRRVGTATWVLHGAIILFVAVGGFSGGPVYPAAGAIGAALALASVAGLTRSRSCGMVELEAACPVNAQAVACARAAALGCVDAAALLAVVFLCGEGPGLWTALAQVCAPYLAAAGVGLLAARRAASDDATVSAVAAAALVCAVCIVARVLFPAAFGSAAALGWWVAAAAALAFAAVEVRAWLRAAGSTFAIAPTRVPAP